MGHAGIQAHRASQSWLGACPSLRERSSGIVRRHGAGQGHRRHDAARRAARAGARARRARHRAREASLTSPASRSATAELSEQAASPDLWNDPERAQAVTRENARVQATIGALAPAARGRRRGAGLPRAGAGGRRRGARGAAREGRRGDAELDALELQQLLGGEHDAGNAIVEIHPGAGGLEAQDWAEMLLRMYLRWAERRGFKAELLELQPGEGAGIKSATHHPRRAVRLRLREGRGAASTAWCASRRSTPTRAGRRRSPRCWSLPDIEDDIEIDDPRRGPAHRHLPLERRRRPARQQDRLGGAPHAPPDRHRRRLPERALAAQEQGDGDEDPEGAALRARAAQAAGEDGGRSTKGKTDIGFGNQIRSYVLHPYRMVKDHRTSTEVGNADAVLDGDLDPFIDAWLRAQLAAGGAGAPHERGAARARRSSPRRGAVITGSHVVYTSGRHGSAYVNKDAVYPHTGARRRALPPAGRRRARRPARGRLRPGARRHHPVAVDGPSPGRARGLRREGCPRAASALRRGYDRLVAGRRVLVVEDVLNTGGSVRDAVAAVRAAGGEVVAVAALVQPRRRHRGRPRRAGAGRAGRARRSTRGTPPRVRSAATACRSTPDREGAGVPFGERRMSDHAPGRRTGRMPVSVGETSIQAWTCDQESTPRPPRLSISRRSISPPLRRPGDLPIRAASRSRLRAPAPGGGFRARRRS